MFEVYLFGIWWNFLFKIFVNEIDENRLWDDLIEMNFIFFIKYNIEIEIGKLKDKLYFMQGDEILVKILNKYNFYVGILGGIVIKVEDENKKYVLICNYLFFKIGECVYIEKYEDMGVCLYIIIEKFCDFVVIEIEKLFLEKCDEFF